MERDGLIQRHENPDDRREKFVELTRRGKSLLRKVWKEQPDQLERVTAGLNDDERRQLARLLNKMIAGQVNEKVIVAGTASTPPDFSANGNLLGESLS